MSFIAAAAIVGGASLASAYMGAKATKEGARGIVQLMRLTFKKKCLVKPERILAHTESLDMSH
jgi:hypothetical protein